MEALVILLGTYAFTLALTESDGAWGSMHKLRSKKWMKDFGLLECHLCTSAWVATLLGFLLGHPELILLAWGGSTLLDKLVKSYSIRIHK